MNSDADCKDRGGKTGSQPRRAGPAGRWAAPGARRALARVLSPSWILALVLAVTGCANRPGPGTVASPGGPPAPEVEPPPMDPAAAALEAWEVLATRRVHAHWNDLLRESSLDGPPGGGWVEVDCEVAADGRLLRAEVAGTTVDAVLTRYCVRAIRDRSPMGALPAGAAPDGRHGWRITFVYEHRNSRRRGPG